MLIKSVTATACQICKKNENFRVKIR